jgi:hypothetical protein
MCEQMEDAGDNATGASAVQSVPGKRLRGSRRDSAVASDTAGLTPGRVNAGELHKSCL